MSIEIIIILILILFLLFELIGTAGLWYSVVKNKEFYDRQVDSFSKAEDQYRRDREYFDKRLLQWEDAEEKIREENSILRKEVIKLTKEIQRRDRE